MGDTGKQPGGQSSSRVTASSADNGDENVTEAAISQVDSEYLDLGDKFLGGGVKLLGDRYMPLMGFGTRGLTGLDVLPAIQSALQAGYRLIDTAPSYDNEKEIGDALARLLPKHGLKREDIFLTSKLMPEEPGDAVRLVYDSAARLQTPYLDLMLIHFPACNWMPYKTKRANFEWRRDVWKALQDMQSKSGKVRAIGVSNYEIRHLEEMRSYPGIPVFPEVNQIELHPHLGQPDLIKHCQTKGIHVQAHTSLGRMNPNLINDPVIVEIAEKHSVSSAQVLLAWSLCRGIGVIPKSQNSASIAANFESVKLKLSKQEVDKITGLDRGFPYSDCAPWNVK